MAFTVLRNDGKLEKLNIFTLLKGRLRIMNSLSLGRDVNTESTLWNPSRTCTARFVANGDGAIKHS